ncbi:MAG: hypothetical protein ABFS24_15570 [Pseudomonadota bacterium]
MPFIHIKSLPFNPSLDRSRIVEGIARDFSGKTGIELFHIHTTWEFFSPGCYAKGDKTPEYQPDARHPLIVDLLTPDFNDMDTIAVMLESIAESISERAVFPKNNIFINHRYAHQGMVFDDGKIVRW